MSHLEDLRPYRPDYGGLDDLITDVIAMGHKADDPEAAHSEEIQIRHRVLLTIASGQLGRRGCIEFAKVGLQTSSYDFPRWTA